MNEASASKTGTILHKPRRELTKIILRTNALKPDIPLIVQNSSMFVIRKTQKLCKRIDDRSCAF